MNARTQLPPPRCTTVVVIGAGQAGLACSHYLSRFGVDHVVLERAEVANAWRTERWDSLRLLTPNWQTRLPGRAYTGDDPDGFMGRWRTLSMPMPGIAARRCIATHV